MKTKSSSLTALIAVLLTFVFPNPVFGDGVTNSVVGSPLKMDIYFTAAPIFWSPDFAAFQTAALNSILNTNNRAVQLLPSGAKLPVTNAMSYYPGNIGGEIMAVLHIQRTNTFSVDQITFITYSTASPVLSGFTNSQVYAGASFGQGVIGANGDTLYTSGPVNGVQLTDLWAAPGVYSISVGQGRTTDQAVADFVDSSTPNFPITLTCVLSGSSASGIVSLQAMPLLSLTEASGFSVLTWPTNWTSRFNYTLQQCVDLKSNIWTTVTGVKSAAIGAPQNSVTVINGDHMFFRLTYP